MRQALWGSAVGGAKTVSLCLAAVLAIAVTPLAAQASADADEIVDAQPAPRALSTLEQRSVSQGTGVVPIDETDALAALDGIRIALTEVADGGSYVWHRQDGRLSGMAQPTGSFKDAAGLPCRHIIVMLNTYARTNRVEGVACRTASGRWQLDG